MRKILMPILMTWAANRLMHRYMHPKGPVSNRSGAARGYNPNFASDFVGNGLKGQSNRMTAAVDAFKNAWKNYRE